ncbi:MAG: glycosyltransferase [Natronomonas sp.]
MATVFLGLALLVVAGIPYGLYLTAGLLRSGTDSPAEKTPAIEPVSVVVPTYNEAAIVEDTLEELCSVEYPAEHLEIVVVDSSDDETAAIVRDFFADRADPTLTLIEEDDRGGVARAVNRAVEAATHDIIFRTDCDARIGAETIRHAVANLQDDAIGGVTGRQTTVLGGSEVEAQYRSLQTRNQLLESHLDSTFIVHGPCFAFRREYFEELPTATIADDTAIAVAIRRQGKRVVLDPAMEFTETGTSDIRGRRTRKDRRAMGLLQLLDRNRDLLGRYGRYGSIVVPFNWWFLSISPWLSIGGWFLILFGISITVPPLGVVAVLGTLVGVYLGQRDRLGRLQAPYAVFDAHLSLLVARLRLWREDPDGSWSVDEESRTTLES